MISLKRLEAMKRWQRENRAAFDGHARWAYDARLLAPGWTDRPLIPTESLAPAIAKAEAEHARHRTLEQREVNRKRDGDANRAKQAAELGLWRWRTWP